jgi:hypothetical protein
MRKMVFGIGAAEMLLTAALIGGALIVANLPPISALWLALALAMSSTALVLPISGTQSPVGRAALAMLLFEDLALVPMLFLIGAAGGAATSGLGWIAVEGSVVIIAILLVGRFVLPALFAQAARSKKPELFLAISLLVVILAATVTRSAGLSPILGALVAGLVIAGGTGVGEGAGHIGDADRFWRSLEEIAAELPGRADEIEAAGEVPGDVVARLSALGAMPEVHQTVILLHLFEDLTFREIGEITGMPAATAATLYYRTLTELRARLECCDQTMRGPCHAE